MDTPESPTQSPQSLAAEEKEISDSDLLNDSDQDGDEDDGGRDSDLGDLEEGLEDGAREQVSEQEEEYEEHGAEDGEENILEQEEQRGVVGGRCRGVGLSADEEEEDDEEEDMIGQGPGYLDSEADHEKPLTAAEEDEDEEEMAATHQEEDDEDEDGMKVMGTTSAGVLGDRGEEEVRRMVSDLKDESSSVSRELDEHELDYDEEVPEEQSAPPPEDEEAEKGAGEEGEEEEDDEEDDRRKKKKEKNAIMAPQKDSQPRNPEEPKAPERSRRELLREKKKDEDDGEIDEGEIDVSMEMLCLDPYALDLSISVTQCSPAAQCMLPLPNHKQDFAFWHHFTLTCDPMMFVLPLNSLYYM